jgi:drug/metabolite transporter (DMT)-like permease
MASLSGVIANVFGKNVTKTLDAIVMTGFSQLLGGGLLLIIGVVLGGQAGVITVRGMIVFGYICIASIIGYCLWYSLIGKNNLSQLYIVKFLEPFFAAIFGMILLNEDVLNVRFLLALLFTGVAIVISNWKTKK